MPPKGQTCSTCLYFLPQVPPLFWEHAGECRRHAPRPLGPPVQCWPLVRPEDWCGEWQKSEAAAQAVSVELIAGTPEPQPGSGRSDPH